MGGLAPAQLQQIPSKRNLRAGQGRAAAQTPLAIVPVEGHMLKGPSCLPAPRPRVSLLVSGVSVCARA